MHGVRNYGLTFQGDPVSHNIEEQLDSLFYNYWAIRRIKYLEDMLTRAWSHLNSARPYLPESVYTIDVLALEIEAELQIQKQFEVITTNINDIREATDGGDSGLPEGQS